MLSIMEGIEIRGLGRIRANQQTSRLEKGGGGVLEGFALDSVSLILKCSLLAEYYLYSA